jgi:hypothetical protein
MTGYTIQLYFFRELNSTFFHRFSAANYDSVLSFIPARQVFEIILNESSESTKNCASKRYNKIFPMYTWVSLVISVVSKTGFEIFLAHLVWLKSEK